MITTAGVGIEGGITRNEGQINVPINRTHAGQWFHRVLNQGNGKGEGHVAVSLGVCTEIWEEMCAALQMTPQRSPFLCDDQGTGVEMHRPLRRRTLYPEYITTGVRTEGAARRQENGN